MQNVYSGPHYAARSRTHTHTHTLIGHFVAIKYCFFDQRVNVFHNIVFQNFESKIPTQPETTVTLTFDPDQGLRSPPRDQEVLPLQEQRPAFLQSRTESKPEKDIRENSLKLTL